MKRVLNSGSIKLPYVQGSEKDLFKQVEIYQMDDPAKLVFESGLLSNVNFTFEIRMPLLVAQSFYNAHLGTLKAQEAQDHQIAYLPPLFYQEQALAFTQMDPKSCNELNTKLNNFYNWSFNFYNKLIESGLCPEQAELILPQGVFKTLLFEINAKDLISFIEQNINKSPEMAGYCSTLVLYMEDHLPNVTAYLKRNQWKDLI